MYKLTQHFVTYKKTLFYFLIFCFLVFAGAGCSKSKISYSSGRPIIVCTTTMITDLVQNLAGNHWKIIGIMKPGQDPHIYEPRPSDALFIRKAKIVFENGLHLEGTLKDIISNNLSTGSLRVPLGEDPRIKVHESKKYKGAPDPHVWMNVAYFRIMAEKCLKTLIQMDPKHQKEYEKRGKEYFLKLDKLHKKILKRMSRIPRKRRVLVTTHDAFEYFGEVYDVEVAGLIGISTDQEPRPQDIENLKKLLKSRKIPTVFIETSVNSGLINLMKKIQRELGIQVGPPLFSDSLGDKDSPAPTYLQMMDYNSKVISESLSKA